MAIPKIAVYIRKNGNFYAAPKTPDFDAIYYLRYYERGKEQKQKVGHVDLLPKAKLLLERRLFAKANGFLLPELEHVSEAAERKTLAQAIDQYIAFQRTRRIKGVLRSAKDVDGIRNTLLKFQKSCGKQFFDDVDEKDLHRFIDQLERRYGSEWTVRNYMITVLAFMRKEGRPGLMTYAEIPDPEPDPTKIKAYREEQIRKLFAAADKQELVWLNFFLYTACREKEVARLTWDRIMWEDRALSLPSNRKFRTKNRQPRLIPLDDTLLEMLRARTADIKETDLIFPSERAKAEGHFLRKIQEIAFRAELACGKCVPHDDEGNEVHDGRACGNGKLGCREYGCHRFRKTCATNWHRKGVPLGDIQAYLGHSSLEITRDYLQVSQLNDPAVRERINGARIQ
jgi:integrase/recombinase XerD